MVHITILLALNLPSLRRTPRFTALVSQAELPSSPKPRGKSLQRRERRRSSPKGIRIETQTPVHGRTLMALTLVKRCGAEEVDEVDAESEAAEVVEAEVCG